MLRDAVARIEPALAPAALRAYTDGAARLHAEGIGAGPIVAYLAQMPSIMGALGAGVLEQVLKAASIIYMRAGNRGVDQFFSLAPLAAARLPEVELFDTYLSLVQRLAAQAPGIVPAFFDHLPQLLEHLTVGALVKWTSIGLQIHARDAGAREKYFSLQSADALSLLKLEGEGVLFSQVDRRLRFYLRALWNRDVPMRPKARREKNIDSHRSFLMDGVVYLPDAYSKSVHGAPSDLYMAAATHAAAHMMFSKERFKVGNYKPLKMVVISLLEDARAELLAIRAFPGLRSLWGQFHSVTPASGATFETLAARLSRALLDEDYQDDNPWVQRGRAMFAAQAHRMTDAQLPIELASPLANDIGQMRLQFNFKTYVVQPVYRDDHSFLWDYSGADTPPPQFEEEDDIIVEEVKTNPQESQQAPETQLKEAEIEQPDPNDKDAQSPHAVALELVVRSASYAEWDYLIGLERPAWCTLFEKQPIEGDAREIDDMLSRDEALLSRIKKLIRGAQIQRAVRLRKQHDGDRLDLDHAIRAVIDLRSGHQPDPRISMRSARRGRDLAVLVLLDLSKSTGDFIGSAMSTVLNLAKESVALLAEAMHDLGDKFALHGFTSNGRRDVTYYRFKDFDQEYNQRVKALLAGAVPLLSTRMGPAIRHAGQLLRFQSAERKLLLMLTDGEPSDIDVADRNYLTHDAKKAVDSLAHHGIHSFCLSLDSKADRYVSRIFGAKNYLVVDRLSSLPEKLPFIYMRVTQH